MPSRSLTLALVNASVLTMERTQPTAEAVAVSMDRIAAVGNNATIRRMASGQTKAIDCQGLTLLPGFNDAHCHLAGLARRLQDLDCSPRRAPSIAALLALVRRWAESRPSESWVRGHGYDDRQLSEGRHPSRWELDIAAPNHPVWLEHRSGHALALNSRALELSGIFLDTPDPPGGVIERDEATGEPTGILFEMRSFLRERLGNIRSPQEFESGMGAAGKLLAEYGITSVQDAGADNGVERWRTFQRLQADAVLSNRITMFAGAERLDELAAAGLSYGLGDHRLRVGHAKIVITLTAGTLHPSPPELSRLVAEAHQQGYPVALHCIEEEAIAVAAEVLASVRRLDWQGCPSSNPPPPGEGIFVADRIEHCAEGTPSLVAAVKRSGATVVTQPGFIYHNGAAYRENVGARLLPHLYPAGALRRAGVETAFGSDAPVIDPNPWPAIYSAVTRRAFDGRPLSGDGPWQQGVSVGEALRMYTLAAAKAEGTSRYKGSIAPGKLADMVLVDTNPLTAAPTDLQKVKAVMTITGGASTWGKV